MSINNNKERKNIFRTIWGSLANRVSIYIIVLIVIIFIGLGILMAISLKNVMTDNLEANSQLKLECYNDQLNTMQDGIVSSIKLIEVPIIKSLTSSASNEAAVNSMIQALLEKHDYVKGCYLCLEKGFAPGRKEYCQRVMQGADGQYVFTQLAGKSLNYYNKDWYLLPKMLKQIYWSSPHYDNDVSDDMLITVSSPLFNSDGVFMGVVCCDMDFKHITRYFDFDSIHQAYCIIVDEDGTIFHHPNEKYILKESIYNLKSQNGDNTWEVVGTNMTNGRSGKAIFGKGKDRKTVFYGPLPRLNWSVAIVYSNQQIQEATQKCAVDIFLEGLIAALMVFFLVRFTMSKFARPIVEMAQAADKMAQGEYNASLPNTSSIQELNMLQTALLNMQNSLSTFVSQIQRNSAWQRRVDHEMEIASNIQLNMLPQISNAIQENPNIDLAAELTPARLVGGDLYDFYLINNHLYFVVADVSGKGFPAALLMVETRSIVRSMVTSQLDPATLLKKLNDALYETNKSEMFVTMFVGLLDLSNGHLDYSNAGHNAPIILHRDGTLRELDVEPNLPLGNFDDFTFELQQTVLNPGDLIFLYTDGISEAEDMDHRLYGIDNIKKSLSKCVTRNAQSTIAQVEEDMSKHVGLALQNDDITAMALRYHNQSCPKDESYLLTLQKIDDLSILNETLEIIAEKHAIPMSTLLNINLAIEEIVVNVIQYSHPGDPASEPFTVGIRVSDDIIEFTVTDDGVNFDPTSAPEVDTNLPLEQRRIGGLGIHLARQIMDEMSYRRLNRSNILTMKKKFETE